MRMRRTRCEEGAKAILLPMHPLALIDVARHPTDAAEAMEASLLIITPAVDVRHCDSALDDSIRDLGQIGVIHAQHGRLVATAREEGALNR